MTGHQTRRARDTGARQKAHGRLCAASLLAALALVLYVPAAEAFGVKVCNRGDADLYLGLVGHGGWGASSWYSKGWIPVKPGRCWNQGSVWEREFYLAFAYRDAKGTFGIAALTPKLHTFSNYKTQHSDHKFCVRPRKEFDLTGSFDSLKSCPKGYVPVWFSTYVTGQKNDHVILNIPAKKSDPIAYPLPADAGGAVPPATAPAAAPTQARRPPEPKPTQPQSGHKPTVILATDGKGRALTKAVNDLVKGDRCQSTKSWEWQNAEDYAFWVDPDGRYHFQSESYETKNGVTQIGMSRYEAWRPGDVKSHKLTQTGACWSLTLHCGGLKCARGKRYLFRGGRAYKTLDRNDYAAVISASKKEDLEKVLDLLDLPED